MTKEINLPEFYVSAKFEDGQLKADRILLKQRGEYVPYVRERTCHMKGNPFIDEFACSECGYSCFIDEGCEGYKLPNYCPNCGAKVVEP